MAKKLYDLAVKTGEYRDQQGAVKGRWQNIGAVMQSDDGNQFVMLAAWFNPAGVVRKDGSESVLLSCFQPQTRQTQNVPVAKERTSPAPAASDLTDDIPF